jgi:hypothetical protein
MDAFEILGPQQLHDLAGTEVVVVRSRARRGTDAAVKATIQFMVKPEVCLNVLEYFLQFLAFNGW